MLAYLASGERDYDKNTLKPWARLYWEVEIVYEGKIRLYLPERIEPPKERTMWVFPAGYLHAWRGDHHRSAQVIVFNFEDMPSPVNEWVMQKGHLELSMDDESIAKAQSLYEAASVEWRSPGLLSSLKWQQLAIEIALLIGKLEHPPETVWNAHQPGMRVQRALRIFEKHLKDGWNVEQVCDAMSVSPVHLRRLFRQVLQSSPHRVLEEIRLNRAKELLMIPGYKLENVASECGYENGSILSKAFKRHYKVSPASWRSKMERN